MTFFIFIEYMVGYNNNYNLINIYLFVEYWKFAVLPLKRKGGQSIDFFVEDMESLLDLGEFRSKDDCTFDTIREYYIPGDGKLVLNPAPSFFITDSGGVLLDAYFLFVEISQDVMEIISEIVCSNGYSF